MSSKYLEILVVYEKEKNHKQENTVTKHCMI